MLGTILGGWGILGIANAGMLLHKRTRNAVKADIHYVLKNDQEFNDLDPEELRIVERNILVMICLLGPIGTYKIWKIIRRAK